MFYKKLRLLFGIILAISLMPALQSVAESPPVEGQEYIVQADDWLSKLADKFYGDPLAYLVIFDATNSKAAQDNNYTSMTNPNLIEIGQKLFIPATDTISAQVDVPVQQEEQTPKDAVIQAQPSPDQLALLAPDSNEFIQAETLPDETGPTSEQQELLATLKNLGAPPELHNEVWLNSKPLKLADLRGKVVIVEFWTYG